jgi:hypothetical protein
MGLMDFLQPFAKGYFEGSVDIMEARAKEKADAKRIADEYKARLTNELTILEKTNELNEKKNQDEIEKNIAKNKDYANALGLTPDYIASLPDNIFETRTSFNDFMTYKSKQYGGFQNWYVKPINFGEYKGQTVQDMELGTKIKTNVNFSKSNVVDNTKTNANISDNIGAVTLGNYDESGGKDENFYGQYLFNPKPTQGYSATTQWVNPTIHTEGSGKLPLSVFQIENTPGAKDYGNDYYYYDAKDKLTKINLSQGWFKANEGIGLDISKKAMNMFEDSQEVSKHMVEYEGNFYPIDIMTTKQNGNIKSQDVTYVSPKLLDLLDINLKQYESVVTDMPDVPVEVVEQKVVGFNSIKIPKNDFSQMIGSDILDYNDTNIIVEPDQRESINFSNLTKAVNSNSKLVFGQDAFGFTPFVEGGVTKYNMTSILSNDPNIEAALAGLTNTTNNTEFYIQDLANKNLNINSTVASVLGFTTTNPVELSSEEATLKVGQAFKSLREDYLKYYTQVLKETPDAYDAEKELYNIPKTLEGGALAIALANINMSEINGIESLVTNRMNFDKSMAMQIKAGEDNIQSVIEKYFPNFMSPSKPGDTTLNQFILENITSENLITLRDGNETEKKAAIAKLKNALVTDVEDATDRNIIADEIDLILTAVIQGNGFITIDQLQKQEGTMSEITGRVSDELQTWLDANKVALPAEINLADEGYDVEDMVGYQIKRAQNEVFIRNNPDHNPETGLKLFVNPNLKPNHVEPRPRRQFFKGLPEPRGGFEDWNRLWGKTHNPDGTPK